MAEGGESLAELTSAKTSENNNSNKDQSGTESGNMDAIDVLLQRTRR